MFANLLTYHIYISVQTLYSVPCWSTFGSNYSLESSWVWRYKLGTPVFGEFLPFSCFFSNRVQIRALAGQLKDIQRLVPKPLLCCLGCVLKVIVLLESEPRPSLRSWALWSRFSSRISLYFAPFIFTSILTSLPVPSAEIHPHSMMLPPPSFTIGMVPGFLQAWRLAFRPKSSILVSSDQRILFFIVSESFRCLFANTKQAVGSPIEELWSSVRVNIGFLVTSLTKALLPRWLSSRMSLGGSKLLHIRMMEATVFLGIFNAAELFWYSSPYLCLKTILSLSSTDNSFDLMAWFLLWHALSTVGPYIDRCVAFQMMSNQFNFPQVDSHQVVETSEGWSMETRWV